MDKVRASYLHKKKLKRYYLLGVICGVAFLILLSLRAGFWETWHSSDLITPVRSRLAQIRLPDRETWMKIMQSGRKIGYAQTSLHKTDTGYRTLETMRILINTMGLAQDIRLKTTGHMDPDFRLSEFEFEIDSGRFFFKARGRWHDGGFDIHTKGVGAESQTHFKMNRKPYLAAGIVDAVRLAGLTPGRRYLFEIFDPASMGHTPVVVRVHDTQEMVHGGITEKVTRLTLAFKGYVQSAWINADGVIVKQSGILGITLEQTSRHDALYGRHLQASQDMTRIAAVTPDKAIDDPTRRKRLKLEVGGLGAKWASRLDGGRQHYETQGIVVIEKEDMKALADMSGPARAQTGSKPEIKRFLGPGPFIQSDNPKIKKLARELTASAGAPLAKARRLIDWMNKNITQRPVISVPDALATLQNRMGDCNEFAVLLAALARAAGLPAKIEAGLVYVRGRFYYHAWNSLYLGQWVTADALFNQLPSDVTHLRLVSGTQQDQLDIMGVIGHIRIKVVE